VGPDDCDDTVKEGTPCDGPDADLCKEGTFACASTPRCSDTTGDRVELCNGVDDDCDGGVDEGLTPCCGNGVCEAEENCASCSQDCGTCPCTTMSLPARRCIMCDATGEMRCGPSTFQWCCPN